MLAKPTTEPPAVKGKTGRRENALLWLHNGGEKALDSAYRVFKELARFGGEVRRKGTEGRANFSMRSISR